MFSKSQLSKIILTSTCLLSSSVAYSNTIPHIPQTINVDGVLNEAIWKDAKKIEINNISWPRDNVPSPVTTTAYIYENGESIFVAFDAKDNNPEKIRAFYRDRDKVWEDDLVGIKIDSFNNSRSAYQFFINPLGVQQDSIENEISKSENTSWDAIWNSAGQINNDGYIVEIELPFQTLNFEDSEQVKTMAMEFLRFYPRDERLRISNMQP